MNSLRITFFIFFLLLGLTLIIFPELDIIISRQFYNIDTKFTYSNLPIVVFIFKAIPIITRIWCGLCSIILIWKIISEKTIHVIFKNSASFLLIAALLGPAFIVSYGLKEHMGRPRPRDIVEFGGTKDFTAPLEISSQCITNCSFSSAHAAMGYYFSALAWISPLRFQNSVFLFAFSFGSLVGFGRILQGGHFFSDIVFSFIIIMLVNEASFRLWKYLQNKLKK